MHVSLLLWYLYVPSTCISLLPHSFWNARHTCLLTLTLHITMILHLHKSEPIKSVHCACEHDVCWADLHPSPRVSRRSFWTLRGTWKFLVNLWILPNMGHMPALRMAKGYVFKWAPNPALADPCGPPFSNLAFIYRNRKIWKVASSFQLLYKV